MVCVLLTSVLSDLWARDALLDGVSRLCVRLGRCSTLTMSRVLLKVFVVRPSTLLAPLVTWLARLVSRRVLTSLVLVMSCPDLVRSVSVPNVSRDSERVSALRVLVVTVLVSRRSLTVAPSRVIRVLVVLVPVAVSDVKVWDWTRNFVKAVTVSLSNVVIMVAMMTACLLVSTIRLALHRSLALGPVNITR